MPPESALAEPATTAAATPVDGPPSSRGVSLRRLPVRAQLGLGMLVAIVVVSTVVPLLSPYKPFQQNLSEAFQGFSAAHPLGTDQLGRDMLVRLAYGARYTIGITLAATVLGAVIGMTAGVIAAYYRRWPETIVMRAVDVMLAFPGVLIAFIVIAVLGTGTAPLLYATTIYSVPVFARLAYGTSKSIMARQFVDAARARGASDARIIWRHIVPNIVPEMVILWTLRLAITAMLVSSLSFLGLGVQPPTPEWGAMLSQGREFLRVEPAMVVVPGVAVSLLIIAINLFGDGLRDAVDPRRRSARTRGTS
ncbi:ABC transporter permease [Dactylosporangium fulvum]|uniref:ABC transporter permease n=1 Tax=Dactylosporangium fulvum TaxID=53359 RepID=A0ABY5WC16_9ACTN|nr:ABC transporter permease [Dactylosporangium fulvum]UWP86796.1 ABC transporter permease [Dactylosporangium fulvum]